jgi:2,4-dienoyl-CoA reductase-like NADH-dependent reductase (Old Yellow Enzyme family)
MDINTIKQTITIRNKSAPSRIVYQPTESNNCEKNGLPTEVTFKHYETLAAGKPGIIHVESIDVTRKTQARSNRMVLHDDTLTGYQELVARMRKINKSSLIIFQLSHAGRLSDPEFKPPVGAYNRGTENLHILTTKEVEAARDDFVRCAVLAWKAGADGIDFKQAHGFLVDDFLHPANLRKDQYGGSFENRIRFFKETYSRMRAQIKDPEFIIGSRISPFEGIPGGCGTAGPDEILEDLTEMIEFVRVVEREGVDFINVSAGYAVANLELLMPSSQYPEGVPRLFGWTRIIKEAVKIPVIGSGYSYLRDGKNNLFIQDPAKKSLLAFAEKNLGNGFVDMIGIGRQAIADPLFSEKVLNGRVDEINWCTTCGGCGALLGNNKPIGCTVYDQKYAEIFKAL